LLYEGSWVLQFVGLLGNLLFLPLVADYIICMYQIFRLRAVMLQWYFGSYLLLQDIQSTR
jgi:hypothetical protein